MPKKNAQQILRDKRKKEKKKKSNTRVAVKKSSMSAGSAGGSSSSPNQLIFMDRFEREHPDFTPSPMDELLISAIKGKLPITFLREFCFYAMNLLDKTQVLVVPDVNRCTLVELFNRDETGRTAYIAAHFSYVQIIDITKDKTDGFYTKCPSLRASVEALCEAFMSQGGDMETVAITFRGGSSEDEIGSGKPRYLTEREFLAHEFNDYFKRNDLIITPIQQPKNHWTRKETPKQLKMKTSDSFDYIITRHGFWFRKSDLSTGDRSCDVVSVDHPKGKSPPHRELFCIVMDHQENEHGSSTHKQTQILMKKVKGSYRTPGYSVPGVSEVGMSGLLLR